VGLDFNYRSTLWSKRQARALMTPIVADNIECSSRLLKDMAELYGIDCGSYSARQLVDGPIIRRVWRGR